MIPADPFGRVRRPLGTLTREERVILLAGAADALLEDRRLESDARVLLGLALRRWLAEGGDLERHLGVRAPRGSHRTPAALRQRLVVRPAEADPPAVTELRRYLLDHREEGVGSTAGVPCGDEL
jgi:hypothetical protein